MSRKKSPTDMVHITKRDPEAGTMLSHVTTQRQSLPSYGEEGKDWVRGKRKLGKHESAEAAAWGRARHERNKRLDASRWAVEDDSPLTPESKAAWSEYRRALHRVTAGLSDPARIRWPEEPPIQLQEG